MFVTKEMPRSLSAEAYRSLRTSIKFSSIDKPIKTIVVTSSIMGEGKSTVVGNLAHVFNQDGARVLVIDCDLRKPAMHYNFFISNREGITDVLIGNTDLKSVIKKIDNSLFLITAGTIPPNPAEVLSSKKMSQFIESIKDDYDYIFIDTPPVGIDASIISSYSDGVIFVVGSNEVDKNLAKLAKERLDSVNANILGVILNKFKADVNNEYYSYDYYGQDDTQNKKRKRK